MLRQAAASDELGRWAAKPFTRQPRTMAHYD